MTFKKQELISLSEHLSSHPGFGSVFLVSVCCSIVCHYVLFSVLRCPYRFPHTNVVRLMSYLCYLCLFM